MSGIRAPKVMGLCDDQDYQDFADMTSWHVFRANSHREYGRRYFLMHMSRSVRATMIATWASLWHQHARES